MISRSAGRSATGASAYRSAERIVDARTGLVFDYERRSGVDHTEILMPESAPDWVQDRSALWNAVEASETRKNSQVAREVRVALPHELSPEQRVELVRGFCQRAFVDAGMVADIALHAPCREGDERNHHAHIMLTTREIGPDGFSAKNRDWNAVERLEDWRALWAQEMNDALERYSLGERVDHRTLEIQRDEAIDLAQAARAQGDEQTELVQTVRALSLDREPLPQLSPGAWYLKERGDDVDSVVEWRRIKLAAQEIKGVALELAGSVRDWLEQGVTHVKSLAERVREAASGMDMSSYAERARELAQGFRSEELADQQQHQEAERQRQKQIEQERERLNYDRGFSL
ncbi:MobQ family relaxase (plasmid) [Brucella pseudogrignonensis]|uniref:MobQ family relaxase n=1 Tax=Brucella pseudogrignonensis TaxID=419475 RepID=UPI0038B66466